MSRIIVKNLPKTASEESLRKLFAKKGGTMTDIQLKYTREGKFRQIAFIGFASEAEAEEAICNHHNSFLGTGMIKVEVCKNLGDADRLKSWSKHTKRGVDDKDGKCTADNVSQPQPDNMTDKYEKDPLFAEFMAIHENRSRKLIWKNDGDVEEESLKKSSKGPSNELRKAKSYVGKEKVSDLATSSKSSRGNLSARTADDVTKIENVKRRNNGYTVTLRGLPCNVKKAAIKEFLSPASAKDVRLLKRTKGVAFVDLVSDADVHIAVKKNRSFLDGHRVTITKYKAKVTAADEGTIVPIRTTFQKLSEELEETAENIAESGYLYVRNLSFSVTVDDLEMLFKPYGPLAEVRVPIDRITRQKMGFAFVVYLIPEHASKAYVELDGTIFQGRVLHILPGKQKEGHEEKGLPKPGGSSYKTERDAKKKSQSTSSHNWNALFLGSNAVADTIVTNYGTTKQDLFDVQSSESIAVRLALGETQLVIETRKFLLNNGIDLDSFSQPASERSRVVIIVKNLSSGTTDEEIRTLFSKYGVVERVVLPPAGVTAVVKFLDPTEAMKAFKNIAYCKFKSLPLYLEWAPVKIFKATDKSEGIVGVSEDACNETDVTADRKQDLESGEEEEEPEDETILFVKNLAPVTTEQSLLKHFEKCGRVHSATISKKKDLKNPGAFQPLGYGFVQYKRRLDCQKAMKFLQLSNLDGQALELKISNRVTTTSHREVKKNKQKTTRQKSTKILVRNIPFEGTKQEIEKLFRTFGELKFVRLPLKTGAGTHRGFGFVDFVTCQDAKRAFNALCHSTHLYGRRLVLEWAETDDSIESLRRKTAEHFHDGYATASKRSRKAAILEQMDHSTAADNDN